MPTPAWPDRFVYVCSATQAAVVNVLPLVHAGVGRVQEMVVLLGSANPQSRDPTTLREAIAPEERLRAFARRHGIAMREQKLAGDPDGLADWKDHVAAVAARLPAGCHLVFNITGGRKQMSMGALIGWLEADAASRHLCAVSGNPLKVEFHSIDGATRTIAPRAGELDLEGYLQSYGYRELAAAERAQVEALFRRAARPIAAFAEVLLAQGQWLVPLLRRAVQERLPDDGRRFLPGPVDPWLVDGGNQRNRETLADALHALDGVAGLRADTNRAGQRILQATHREGARLLNGGWLEAELFNRLERRLAGRPHVSVAANVRLAFDLAEAADAKAELGELDVAVMVGSQLHVLEAKTGHFGGKGQMAGERAFGQVEQLKRSLLGQFGRLLLVQSRETDETLAAGDGAFPDRARGAGIDLLLGPDAVAKAEARVERLVDDFEKVFPPAGGPRPRHAG